MTDMQVWYIGHPSVQIAGNDVPYVTLADAEAAIAAAEQRAYDHGVRDMKPQANRIDAMLVKATESAERDMLARAIEAVEDMPHDAYCAVPNAVYPIPVDCTCRLGRVLAALRALGGDDE